MVESQEIASPPWGLAAHRTNVALVAAALLLLPSTADAQARRWGVVSATVRRDDLERAFDVGEPSRAALATLGEVVVPPEHMTSRIEEQLSRPYHEAPPELVRRIGQVSEQVLELVAFGRNQRALDRGGPLLAELDPHVAGLGRNEQAARDVTNLCLYMVRAQVQKRDIGAARQQAQLCLRLVPDLAADPNVHPPAVLELVAEHRARLDAGQGGILAIHASPGDPSSCPIRVNGRAIGTSPIVRATLPPGTYLVQMECARDRPGRVHSVTVSGEAPTRIDLQARLAQSLETRPGVGLVYESVAQIREKLNADVAALGRVLETNRVLVVVYDGAHAALRAFEISEGAAEITGSAPVVEPLSDETIRGAVRDVIAGRSPQDADQAAAAAPEPDAAASIDTPATAASVASSAPNLTGPIALMVGGGVLAIAGGVLVGVAVADVAHVENPEQGTSWSSVSDAYERSKPLSIAGGVAFGVGAALAVGGLIWLAVPTQQHSSSASLEIAPGLGGVAVRGSF